MFLRPKFFLMRFLRKCPNNVAECTKTGVPFESFHVDNSLTGSNISLVFAWFPLFVFLIKPKLFWPYSPYTQFWPHLSVCFSLFLIPGLKIGVPISKLNVEIQIQDQIWGKNYLSPIGLPTVGGRGQILMFFGVIGLDQLKWNTRYIAQNFNKVIF